jgi:hypothetical protein
MAHFAPFLLPLLVPHLDIDIRAQNYELELAF